ncbi:alpha/beta hydrolase [Candidatus Roizmanbacteria bacterium]|nr:alpha/beta hydrolase [Candidatus Roizmanbacteria bacterium]
MQIIVDGVLTHYEIVGGGKKDKLLILHGWQRSLKEWLPVSAYMSDSYEVILLDLPGFGQTSKPDSDYSIYDYANFVKDFLGKISCKKVSLLGHSFGGRVGIILGANTSLIDKLVLVDAAGIEKRSALAKIKIFCFKVLKHLLPSQALIILRNLLGSRDYKSAGTLRNIFIKVINEDLSYLLSKIHNSTYLIWGENDEEVPISKAKRMKKMIPNSRLRIVWKAGHSPHIEKQAEFKEILIDTLLSR